MKLNIDDIVSIELENGVILKGKVTSQLGKVTNDPEEEDWYQIDFDNHTSDHWPISMIKIDLFENQHYLPDEVLAVVNRHTADWDATYENCTAFLNDLEAVGYTFDSGLDAEPYDLRKITSE